MIEEKFMKLLADTNKLKSNNHGVRSDNFKYQIESKFNCSLSNVRYQKLLIIIETEITIQTMVDEIINQVMKYHNP